MGDDSPTQIKRLKTFTEGKSKVVNLKRNFPADESIYCSDSDISHSIFKYG
jgi:hypothetical protein